MKCFHDSAGRSWTLSVNVGTIKRVRALCNINLLDVIKLNEKQEVDMALLEQLSSDPVLLVDVLYAVCKEDADKQNISDEDFGRAMAGDAITEATNALIQDLVDFFPETKRRILNKVLTASRRFEMEMNKRIMTLCEDGKMDEMVDAELKRLSDSFTNVQESVE